MTCDAPPSSDSTVVPPRRGFPLACARSRNINESSSRKRTERLLLGEDSSTSIGSVGDAAVASIASTMDFKGADSDFPWRRANSANRSFISRGSHVERCFLLLILAMSLCQVAAVSGSDAPLSSGPFQRPFRPRFLDELCRDRYRSHP